MKIKNAILATSLASGLLATGCSDWIDVNHNPNYPEQVATEMMLPSIEVTTGYVMMSWDYLFLDGIFCQYLTQAGGYSQFKSCEQFNKQEFSSTYRNLFANVLTEAKTIKEQAGEESGMYVAAELMSIYVWQVIVDAWGDVPYSEALNTVIFAPKFDKAEDIYDDLIKRLDGAIEILENHLDEENDFTLSPIAAKYDFLYGGDLEQWYYFANSLKLRFMNRLSNTGKFTAQEIYDFAYNAYVIEENCQIKETMWESKSGKKYPMDEYDNGNFCKNNINASMSIVSYMEKDPRIEKIFDGRKGKIQGYYDGKGAEEVKSKINGETLVRNIPLISTWEIYFDIAEACLNVDDEETAQYCYEYAVAESFVYWGLEGKEEVVLGASGYQPWVPGDKEANFRSICMQRWASFMMTQHGEGFNEINRTGIPEVSDVTDYDKIAADFPRGYLIQPVCGTVIGTNRPKSMAYPQSYVLDLNSNAPKQKIDMTQKIFWQK